ncbi:MAG: hypothetical protein OEZ37_12085, partial [Gemmatimonadota bacterium]|nr:hypothetical protein [Gemmatimonadota bacterium]
EEGCRGWESARFSADGRRVFLESSHVCDGNVERSTRGLMALTAEDEWVDIRVMMVDGEEIPWVLHYALTSQERAEEAGFGALGAGRSMAVVSGRLAAAGAMSVEDLAEASEVIGAKGAEAWIAESGRRFDLDADVLVQMADAGIPESVIDMMVAVSNPRSFQVHQGPGANVMAVRQGPEREGRRGSGTWGYRPYRLYFDPWLSPYGYSRYGYSGFGYSPYGYSGYGYGGYYGGYQPTVYIVDRRDDTPTGGGGRMVRGRGYVPSQGSSSGGAVARTPSRSSGSSGTASGSSGSSSSGSRSGAASTGRTARRRGG